MKLANEDHSFPVVKVGKILGGLTLLKIKERSPVLHPKSIYNQIFLRNLY